MVNFIKLIRPINLIIIVLTMYIMRDFIIGKVLLNGGKIEGTSYLFPHLSQFDFFLLTLSTVLLAAAGNIINDYFDLKADRINKPEKIIVGKYVKRRVAMAAHTLFNIIAVGIGLYIAIKYGKWWFVIVQVMAATLLFFYSIFLKRKFLLGNIAISFLSAFIPFLVLVYELPEFLTGRAPSAYHNLAGIFVLFYALFAFLLTLIREIQKDLADIKGDKAIGCQTIPIVLGTGASKLLIGIMLVSSSSFLIYAVIESIDQLISNPVFLYFSGLVLMPLLISLWFTIKGKERKQFLTSAFMVKIAMGFAIIFPLFADLMPK